MARFCGRLNSGEYLRLSNSSHQQHSHTLHTKAKANANANQTNNNNVSHLLAPLFIPNKQWLVGGSLLALLVSQKPKTISKVILLQFLTIFESLSLMLAR